MSTKQKMTNTYTFSRKIHRILVLIIMVLGLTMAVTGMLLKYTWITSDYLTGIDLTQVRSLHNALSTYFGIVLVLMIITGIWMYFYPPLKKALSANATPPDKKPPAAE